MDNELDRVWLTSIITNIYENHLTDIPKAAWFHTFRMHLEEPIQRRLRTRYMPALQTWWCNYTLPLVTDVDKTIFLYETRQHPHLAFTILNACYYARGWSLIIYCTPNNLTYVRAALGHNAERARICMIDAGAGTGEYNADRDSYNQFLKSKKLWSALAANGTRYVLMTELDAYLRDFIPDEIEEFDYICSEWPWYPDEPGGGGISIRRVEKMLELCDMVFEPEIPHQDCWTSAAICRVGGVANNRLFAESKVIANPVGMHQWWSFIACNPPEAIDTYVTYLRFEGICEGLCNSEHEYLRREEAMEG